MAFSMNNNMPQGFTEDQLIQMGAKPVGVSEQQLQSMGAKPGVFQPAKPVSNSPFNPNTPNGQYTDPKNPVNSGIGFGGVMDSIGQGFKQTGNALVDPLKAGAKNVQKITSGIKEDYKQGGQSIIDDVNKTSTSLDYNPQTQQNAGTTLLDTVGNVAKTAFSPITQTLNVASQDIADKASNIKSVQDFANSPMGDTITGSANDAQKKYEDFATKHPEAAKDLESSFNVAQLMLGAKGEKPVTDTLKNTLDTAGQSGKTGLTNLVETAKTGLNKAEIAGQKVLDTIHNAGETRAASKASADALEVVKPKLTATEEAAAKAQGRGTTNGKIFKKVEITPSAREVEMGNVAQEAGVKSSNTFDQNIQAMKDFQKASAEKVRAGFQEADKAEPLNFTKTQFKGQLGNVANSVEKPITIVGDSEKIATKFKKAIMKMVDDGSVKVGNETLKVDASREGLLNLRQGLDQIINDQLPSNIYSKDTPLGQYVKNFRKAITDFTESKIPDGKLPDGSSFKGELRKQSLLYDAIDNVAEKAPKTGENARPGLNKAKKILNKPIIKYGLGALGAEQVAKKLGLPLP